MRSGKSGGRQSVAIWGLLVLGGLSMSLPDALPAEETKTPPADTTPSTVSKQQVELFLALLKRRAQEALEAHRPPPKPLFSVTADLAQGYESNPLLDGERRGDFFTEESLSLMLSPELTPWLGMEFAYDLLNSHYAEFRDANILENTVSSTVKLRPHRRFQTALRYQYSDLDFPFDTSNSFADHRVGVELETALAKWLTHKSGWTYQRREYDTRKAQDGSGDARLDTDRLDKRHAVSQTLSVKLSKTSIKLIGQFYRNDSNDTFQDFYDWDDGQVRLVMSRVLGAEWFCTVVASHERKHYRERSVPAINVAERDNLLTLAGSLVYLINDHAHLAYSLTYRYQDSNDPRLDFTDWINQVRFSVNF